jgi:hypothetical protein
MHEFFDRSHILNIKPQEQKIPIILDLTPEFYRLLEALEQSVGSESKAGLIREALQLYNYIARKANEGYTFKIQKGPEEKDIVFFKLTSQEITERTAPMNEQTNHSPAASAAAQPGQHEPKGQPFSPRTVPRSPKDEADEAPSQERSVPIGRPIPDALYRRLKKAAETEPPDPSEPKGHQDQSVQP